MGTVPIRRGAPRPRSRRVLLPALARLLVIAGLAVAGWLALSALNDTAHAAQRDEAKGLSGDDGLSTLGHFAPGRQRPSEGTPQDGADAAPGPEEELAPEPRPATEPRPEPRPSAEPRPEPRPATEPRPEPRPAAEPEGGVARSVAVVERDMRDLGADPKGYLEARGRDVLDDEKRAVRTVRRLTAATGVRIPAVHPGRAIGGLVRDVSEARPVLGGAPPAQGQAPLDQPGAPLAEDDAGDTTRPGDEPAVSPPSAGAARPGGHDAADDHEHLQARHRAPGTPGPVLPTGQDGPHGDGLTGGHGSGPIADLRAVRYPAVPPAPGRGAFHRTALVDLTAPGGPTVVPD